MKVSFWALLGPGIVIFAVMYGLSDMESNTTISLTGLVAFIFLPLTGYYLLTNITRWQVLRNTLAKDAMVRFEGVLSPDYFNGLEEISIAGVALKIPGENYIEVHHKKNYLHRINGRRIDKWEYATLTRAALPPPEVMTYALPAEWEPAEGVGLLRRRMSSAEVKELRSYSSFLGNLRLGRAFFITWAIGIPGKAVLDHVHGIREETFWLLLCGVLFILSGIEFYKAWKHSGKYRHDADSRWVIIYDPGITDPDKKADLGEELTKEILPVSNGLWRIGDRPALWRNMGCDRKKI